MRADPPPAPERPWRLLAVVYAALIVHGSLYPYVGWTAPHGSLLAFLDPVPGRRPSFSDLVSNVFVYVPLGFLLARVANLRARGLASIVVPTLAGFALSFAMETLQQWLPSRVASLADLVANTLGTTAGALLARVVHAEAPARARLLRWRDDAFRYGTLADLGLGAIGLWALSQTMPLVPSLDVGNLREGLAPLWHTLLDPGTFDVPRFAAYATSVAGLALVARTFGRDGRPVLTLFFLFALAVLAYKIPVVHRALSLEAVAGLVAAWLLVLPALALPRAGVAAVAAALVAAAFVIGELAPVPGGALHPFSWTPFIGQMQDTLQGLGAILEVVWQAVALACLARELAPPRGRAIVAVGGTLAIGALAFALEWHQQAVPGRYGDATTALLMAATWIVAWAFPLERPLPLPAPRAPDASPGPASLTSRSRP